MLLSFARNLPGLPKRRAPLASIILPVFHRIFMFQRGPHQISDRHGPDGPTDDGFEAIDDQGKIDLSSADVELGDVCQTILIGRAGRNKRSAQGPAGPTAPVPYTDIFRAMICCPWSLAPSGMVVNRPNCAVTKPPFRPFHTALRKGIGQALAITTNSPSAQKQTRNRDGQSRLWQRVRGRLGRPQHDRCYLRQRQCCAAF